MPAYLTVYDLYDRNACEDQVLAFQRLFGDAAEVTARNLRRAQRAGLNTDWCDILLTPEALKVYDETCAPAWNVYDEACAAALLVGLQTSLAI